MDPSRKDALIAEARDHLRHTGEALARGMYELGGRIGTRDEGLAESDIEELRMMDDALRAQAALRLEELRKLAPSPYFQRIDLKIGDEGAPRRVYVGKFPFDAAGIISWMAPAAAVRFEDPGPVRYQATPTDKVTASLLRKDQFMIVDGKIVFMATEDQSEGRQMVYQEYLSNRRGGFALPEIVAQMEKAQDEVIRADHKGPFVISGPAGSGKTTLALHRVAYLTQAPDTARLYPGHALTVFVQDNGTKEYFSHLLPELGITDVRITTFSEWALGLLGLEGEYSFAAHVGGSRGEQDAYEYAKAGIARDFAASALRGSPYAYLEAAYRGRLSAAQLALFQNQRRRGILDRYDLTLLLLGLWQANPGFSRERHYSIRLKDGRTKLEARRQPLRYPLIVVDEFQNYLPAQLRLFRRLLHPDTGAILYVGDMAQQTAFGTVRDWEEVGEPVPADRQVRLHKVYRNTRQILEFIRGLGYGVTIPEGLKEGPAVTVREGLAPSGEVEHVRAVRERLPEAIIGVLARDASTLEPFAAAFADDGGIRCMTMQEAQGVEFDAVVLAGIDRLDAEPDTSADPFERESRRIERDILYVALTRAISELHVLKW